METENRKDDSQERSRNLPDENPFHSGPGEIKKINLLLEMETALEKLLSLESDIAASISDWSSDKKAKHFHYLEKLLKYAILKEILLLILMDINEEPFFSEKGFFRALDQLGKKIHAERMGSSVLKNDPSLAPLKEEAVEQPISLSEEEREILSEETKKIFMDDSEEASFPSSGLIPENMDTETANEKKRGRVDGKFPF